MRKLKAIWEIIKNNKIFVFIGLILFFILILVIFDTPKKTNLATVSPTISYYSTQDYTVFNENGKITVEVHDAKMADKNLIRNTLKIPADIDFDVSIPGAALPKGPEALEPYNDNPTPFVSPTSTYKGEVGDGN